MSGYRWTILTVGTAAQTAYSGVFLGIPILAPALRVEYDLTLPEAGLVIAAVNVGSVVTLLPWGLLADRLGERYVLGTGLSGASAALTAAAFAPSLAIFVVAIVAAYPRNQRCSAGRMFCHTCLVSRYSSSPAAASSRPMPDCL